MAQIILIGLFGAFGVCCRFGVDRLFTDWNEAFPISTLGINILGSFAAGSIFVMGENHYFSPSLKIALLVGFCGGFTTFSAYTLQTVSMIDRGKILNAMLYLAVSPMLSLGAAFLAVLLTRKLIV